MSLDPIHVPSTHRPILIHVSTVLRNEAGEVLFVREAKAVTRGKWNLPGGHLELQEDIAKAALREVREETLLETVLVNLVGVYNAHSSIRHSIRFVFEAKYTPRMQPQAGDEILEVAWMRPEAVIAMRNDEIVGSELLRAVLRDVIARRAYPLAVLSDVSMPAVLA